MCARVLSSSLNTATAADHILLGEVLLQSYQQLRETAWIAQSLPRFHHALAARSGHAQKGPCKAQMDSDAGA